MLVQTGSVVDAVTSELFGSRKIRLSPTPTAAEQDWMKSLVNKFVAQGKQIEAICNWVAVKKHGKENKINDAERDAFIRLMKVNMGITESYAPGLKTTIMMEDASELVITGHRVINTMYSYIDSMRDLVRGAENHVVITTETKLLEERGIAIEKFSSIARSYGAAFLSWYQGTPEAEEILRDAGWSGTPAWDHYQKRVASEYPNSTLHERIERVALCYGCVLTRRVFGIRFDGLIRVSFCPYPPGVDRFMYRGRVEYKLHDNKNSHNNTPPWLL